MFLSYHGNQLSNLKIDFEFEISMLTLCWCVSLKEISRKDKILEFRPVTYLNIIIAVVVVVWILATEVMFHELALTLQLLLNGVMGVG